MNVTPTWESRELPLLMAVARCEVSGTEATTESLAEATGIGVQQASLGVRALYDADYLTGIDVTTMGGPSFDILNARLMERGRRATGQWPSDPAQMLLTILDERIAQATDTIEKGGLERLRDATIGIGRDVLTSVLSAFARQAAGLP